MIASNLSPGGLGICFP